MGTFAMRRAVPASRFRVQDRDAHQSFRGLAQPGDRMPVDYKVKSFTTPGKAEEWVNEMAAKGYHVVSTSGLAGLPTVRAPNFTASGTLSQVWVFMVKDS